MDNPFTDQNRATVLYIEDRPDNRLLIRRVLMAEGFNVLEAGTAVEALEVVKKQTPDLILMDINMPDIDGYTLTSRLKSIPNLSHVPIIAVTANVMRGDRERSLEAGCDSYIQKPIDVDTIGNQIRRFLKLKK